MGNYKQLTKNTLIFAIGSLSVKAIQFFLMPLITVAMTAEDYGTAESLVSLVELIIPLFTLGLQDAVFRFTMRDDVSPKSILSSTLAVAAGGFVFVAMGAALAIIKLDYRLCLCFGAVYICVSLSNIFGQFVRGTGKIKTFASSGILQALVLAGATSIFVYWKRMGTYGYLMSLLLAYSSSLLVLFFIGGVYKNISFKAFDKSVLKQMLNYGLPLIPNAISWWFIQVVNRYIIIYFCGSAQSGLYIATSRIATLINICGTIFLQAWTISAVQSINDKDKGQFNTNVFKYYASFLQIAATCLLLILPFVSRFLLKGEFADSWNYSAVGIFTAILSCYASFFGAYYGAAMKNKMVLVSTLAGAVSNTLGCLLLAPFIGIGGAYFAAMIGYFVLAMIRIFNSRKYSMIKINWVKEIIALGLILAQALFIMYNKNAKPLIFYGIQAIICLAVISIRLKDLIALIKTLLNAIKAKKNGGQEKIAEQTVAEDNQEIAKTEGESKTDGRD
ncbi:MAG: lipopolysaccharide biosynthesis protein [Clostridia bacterium]|nr:lipopolysaccharide biosynthesis protein [Clostridia bacterium]